MKKLQKMRNFWHQWKRWDFFGLRLPSLISLSLFIFLLVHMLFKICGIVGEAIQIKCEGHPTAMECKCAPLLSVALTILQNTIAEVGSDTVRNLSLLLAASIGWFFLYWRAKTTDLNAKAAEQSAEAARKNTEISEQGLTVERLTRATEQLANKEDLFVRLGGILGLEQIANTQEEECMKIARILATFIRTQATRGSDKERQDPIAYRSQRLDVEAAIHALANIASDLEKHEQFSKEYNKKIQLCDLQDTDLRGLRFVDVDLSSFNLACADMSGTWLVDTNLNKALLYKNHTAKGASLEYAILEGANFSNARLNFVNFFGIKCAKKAKFIGAHLHHANFTNTAFNEVEFKAAILNGANLTGAYWSNMPDIRQYQINKAFRWKGHDTTITSAENHKFLPPPEIEKAKQRWGFGMAPIKPNMQEKRKNCVRNVLSDITDERINKDHVDSLSEVKGLFSRIYKQDQWDWFTVFEQLGHPGRIKSKSIASNISTLRKAFSNNDNQDISKIFQNLNNLDVKRHLEQFLNQKKNVKESEKVYILSTREQPRILKIGFTTRSLAELVDEVNSAAGVTIPYGVRALWSIKNARQIEKRIHHELSKYRMKKDREFFEMDYREAFKIINQILREGRIKEL